MLSIQVLPTEIVFGVGALSIEVVISPTVVLETYTGIPISN